MFVVDVDRIEALDELPEKLPKTLTIRTPRGVHLYFKHVGGVTNSPGSLPRGIDVRGEGGYVLLPPSSTDKGSYTVENGAEIASAPEWLLELIRDKKPAATQPRGKKSGAIMEGGPVCYGTRNTTLTSIAGSLHDGTRDQAHLIEDLLATNEQRCVPPLEEQEVEKIARWAFGKEPCKQRRDDPEVAEIVKEHERIFWECYGESFKGLGGQSDRDLLRAVLEKASKFGRLGKDGWVEFDASGEEMAREAALTRPTVYAAAKRLQEKIGLRRDTYHRKATHAGKWMLPPPAKVFTTLNNAVAKAKVVGVVKSLAPKVVGLSTPAYRHFGPVGKGRGGVQLALEEFGPMSLERLGEVLGAKRLRDLRRNHLEPMVEEGRVELRGDLYALPGDHEERCGEALDRPYGRTHRRRVRRRSSPDGMPVVVVAEFGRQASQRQRAREQARRYAVQQELFRKRVEAEERRPEEDREVVALLNAWDQERELLEQADGFIEDLERVGECL